MARRRGRVGRPALPPEAARDQRVNLRLNAEEFGTVTRTAAAVGLTVAAYVRRAALGTVPPPPPVVPAVNLDKWEELGRALSNFNQLVREVHGGRVPAVGPDVLPMLRTIRDELHATRETLRGRVVRRGAVDEEPRAAVDGGLGRVRG